MWVWLGRSVSAHLWGGVRDKESGSLKFCWVRKGFHGGDGVGVRKRGPLAPPG